MLRRIESRTKFNIEFSRSKNALNSELIAVKPERQRRSICIDGSPLVKICEYLVG